MKSTEVYNQKLVRVAEQRYHLNHIHHAVYFVLKTSSQHYIGWACSIAMGYPFKSGCLVYLSYFLSSFKGQRDRSNIQRPLKPLKSHSSQCKPLYGQGHTSTLTGRKRNLNQAPFGQHSRENHNIESRFSL